MSLIMPDGSRTISYGPQGSGFPQYEDFMGQAGQAGNKAAAKLAAMQPKQQQTTQQAPQQPSQPAKGLDMSAYKPGQAQPIQPQSQGTPYQPSNRGPAPLDDVRQDGPQPGVDYRQYSTPTLRLNADGSVNETGMVPQYPPQAPPVQYSPSFLDGGPISRPGQGGVPQDAIFRQPTNTQSYTTPSFTYSPGGTPQYGGPGNVANDPYGKPPPFVSTMTDMFGNPTTADQFYPQQDAFIAQLLERMGQIQGGTWLGQGPPPQDFGRRPDMNFGEMWNQGGQMVQDGWRNPFAAPMFDQTVPQYRPGTAQPIQPPSQGTPYDPYNPPLLFPYDPNVASFPPRPGSPFDYDEYRRAGGISPHDDAYHSQPNADRRNSSAGQMIDQSIPEYRPSQRDYTPQEFEEYRRSPPGRKDLGNGWVQADAVWRDSDRILDYRNYEHYLQDQNRVRRNVYEQPTLFSGGRLNSQYADMYAPPMSGWYY